MKTTPTYFSLNNTHYSWCKTCAKDPINKYLRTTYNGLHMRGTCVCSYDEFSSWSKTNNDFKQLYTNREEMLANGTYTLADAPSIDAILPRSLGGIYSLQNMRWVSQGENSSSFAKSEFGIDRCLSMSKKTSKAIIQIDPKTLCEIKHFDSISDAKRYVKLNYNAKGSEIGASARKFKRNQKRAFACGYYWQFK